MDKSLAGMLTLVLAFWFMLLVFIGTFVENSEQFTITKEDCWNETSFVKEQCYFDNETLYSEAMKCWENAEWIEFKHEICEQVEVEEIDISVGVEGCINSSFRGYDIEVQAYNFATTSGFKNLKQLCEEEGFNYISASNPQGSFRLVEEKTILKQDLTREWLDENAECIYGEDRLLEKVGENEYVVTDKYFPDTCTKWSLGDYSIDVEGVTK